MKVVLVASLVVLAVLTGCDAGKVSSPQQQEALIVSSRNATSGWWVEGHYQATQDTITGVAWTEGKFHVDVTSNGDCATACKAFQLSTPNFDTRPFRAVHMQCTLRSNNGAHGFTNFQVVYDESTEGGAVRYLNQQQDTTLAQTVDFTVENLHPSQNVQVTLRLEVASALSYENCTGSAWAEVYDLEVYGIPW